MPKIDTIANSMDWISLPYRRVIAIKGDDAFNFVGNLFSNNPKSSSNEKELCYAALMKAQGQVISDVIFAAIDDTSLLCEIDGSQANDILSLLSLYRLKAKVSLELTDLMAEVGWHGLEKDIFTDEREWRDPRGLNLRSNLNEPLILRRRFVSTITSHNENGLKQWRELRHANGLIEFGDSPLKKPVYALDINFDLWGGVDFQKGCFIGQEMTSRMKRRGQIKNRLVGLKFSSEHKELKSMLLSQENEEVGEIIAQTDDSVWLANLRIDRYRPDQALYLGTNLVTISGIALR